MNGIKILLVLRSNSNRQDSRRHLADWKGWRELREEERRKTPKNRSEEKVVGFRSASLFPARKQETVTQSGTIQTGGKTT